MIFNLNISLFLISIEHVYLNKIKIKVSPVWEKERYINITWGTWTTKHLIIVDERRKFLILNPCNLMHRSI